jgi:hypothetical protein
MSEQNEKVAAFQADFLELMKKHEVGLWGTMYFRIGDEELLLDTTQGQGMEPDAETEQPDVNEETDVDSE